MTPEEKRNLSKQYGQFPDSQIINMLADGPEAYVEGAYALLQQEAKARGLSMPVQVPASDNEDAGQTSVPGANPDEAEALVELVVVNSEADKVFLDSLLSATDIPYYFQNLNIRRELTLPAALMVAASRVEETIGILKDFKPSASIILW